MNESIFEKSLVSDDFRTKEFEKFLLSRKYFEASKEIGFASAYPTIENISRAYGMVVDYITSIPVSQIDKVLKKRNELLADLSEVSLILHGKKENKEVKTAMDKLHIGFIRMRKGMSFVDTLTELPNLVKQLQTILIEAGDNAVIWGLRIPVSELKSKGMDKLLEEEGFADEDEEEEAAATKESRE